MKKTTIVLLIILFVGMVYNKYQDRPKYILNDTDSVRQLRINDVSIEESELLNEMTKLLQATQYGKKHKVLRLNHDDVVKYNISFMYGEKLRHLLLEKLM